ncbi:MAG: hypothetical protein ACKKMV_00425 [Candidatus Nealsonbacteria bacterium]
MKKEKIRKEKKEPPKVLVQTPSIYLVRVDLKSPRTKEFSKKTMERLAQNYPLYENQVLELEFGLKDSFLPKIVETFNKCKKDEYYGVYEQMFFSRSPEKIIEDKLLALSNFVGGFLRDLGFEIPAQDIEIDSEKIRTYIKAIRLEKINNALKKYREKSKKEKILGDKKIKKITIIEMNNGKHLFAINDNYKEAKEIKEYSEWWQVFIKEVRERNMRPETRTNVKAIPKNMTDYFNYNAYKCPIYMGGKYNLTNIFVGREIDVKINPEIRTEIILEKKYLIRLKRKKKK